MDSIVHAALEEICAEGVNGLTLPNLWPKLQSSLSSNGLHLCTNVKKAIWTNLLNIPGLQFKSKGANYNAQDCSVQSVEKCEEMNLAVVAAENLRNSFIGIYDIKASDAGIPQPQRRALERLAIARTNGVTQSELAKEFGMKGNNIFYVLRKLECRGLIVRQSTVLRRKEICNEGEAKNSSIVTTNMLHLYRYAKHLGCQQRMEITKEDKISTGNENVDAASGAGVAEECVKEDVVIKDFLPALKAICDKLEKADGKVLVVSDIKQELGYRGTSGHRAWRNICNRLKDACVVEEFLAKVNKKEVSCLRLLKKFSPKNFEAKTPGCRSDDLDMEQPLKLGKRGQINDQLIDLPIEHQIYDMIDAEGSKGLKITEVYERLGINNKKYYDRLLTLFSRFGMHLQAESHNKGAAYRVWTSGNLPFEASNISKPEHPSNENGVGNSSVGNLDFQKKSTPTVQGVDRLTPECSDKGATAEHDSVVVDSATSNASPTAAESSDMLLYQSSSQNLPPHELSSIIVPDTDLQIVEKTTESSPDLSEKSTPKRRRRSYPKYPCLALSAVSTQREQRIIELLKEEKFIVKPDLHRQIENLEKDKHTMMDRKTLERSLNKLQQEGHCKLVRVSVPVVSDCKRSRAMDVVLHPSYKDVSPGLLGQIHDRMRAFDMESRGHGYSRLRKHQSLPVLDGVERTSKIVKRSQAERSEALRANGFVLAKMVRLKLLHIFLWGYLNGLPGWDDALLSGKHGYDHKNPHSTCKSFDLDAAIKSLPLELFLQVVGSTRKFEDLVEKCRVGLRLSDLPVAEYKLLMDTQATGRLSYLIDILRRLKLMRTVSVEHSEGAVEVPHTTLTYALELKPYIEEPVTMVEPSSGFMSFDFRPQIRHDFVLSSREAVDEYWNTLEYCYAAADSKAALHAFPGSAVHEVFLFRSWVSVRVMTADQRAQLLERIVNEDSNKKLSFKECETIAKDLNLTLEQVLRVYYDKRQKRISKGVEDYHILKKKSSRKRKRRSSRQKSSNHVKAGFLDGESSGQRHDKLSDTDDQLTEEQSSPLSSSKRNDHMEAIEEEPGSNEEDDEDGDTFIRKVVPKLNPCRGKKFSWTEEADRQLVILYARHRATLGAKFHRVDWGSLRNLPAPPNSCKRRMAVLNNSTQFRKAIMRLCNLLSERYSKYLDKFQSKSSRKGDSNAMVRNCSPGEDCNMNVSNSLEQNTEELDHEVTWDDFNNKKVKMALDEVLLYKKMAKLDPSHGVGSIYDEYSDLNMDVEGHDPQGSKVVSSAPSSLGTVKVSGKKLSCHRIPRKYIKLLNEGMSVDRRAYESLAVSNAAELFKLVFLSTSTAPEVPNLLAETLRRYSEHDLFAAFHYLREKKIMIGGNGNSPFVLSQQFLQRISSSPFPSNTGKRAAKFANWLRERGKDMMEEGIDLTADLQCGDIIHLFAKVTSGELLIQPFLPDQGVGEAEDSRTSKRKSDDNEEGNKSKKLKPSPLAGEGGEIISRREKGFPGIRISLSCAVISKADVVEFGKNMDPQSDAFPSSKSDNVSSTLVATVTSDSTPSDPMKELLNCGYTVPSNVDANESPWEAMAQYVKHILTFPFNQEQGSPLCPELFRTVHSAIQKAGDQGLSIEEMSEVMNIHGEKLPELIIEVLEAFGCALKVNGYASVRVVDSLYRPKYFLTPVAGLHQDHKVGPLSNPERRIIGDDHLISQRENCDGDGSNLQTEMSRSPDEMHRVTILNLPPEEVAAQPTNEIQSVNEIEGSMKARVISPERDQMGNTSEVSFCDSNLSRPILPWINGDGTINIIVYRGLVRRILGIVMQNPGILEDDILSQMRVLNPQSCRSLLELMILDHHIFVRKMNQTMSGEPPGILGRLLGNSFKKSKMISKEHFFANPMCTSFL